MILVEIYYNKKHIGKDNISKNYMLDFAKTIRELNTRRNNNNKINRINIIINWLINLNQNPTIEEKLNLINMIKNLNNK
jgi:hypothetical protein